MIRHLIILIVTLTLLSVSSFAQSSKYVQHRMDKAPKVVTGVDDQPSFYEDFKARQTAINRQQQGTGAAPVDLIIENYDWMSNSYQPQTLIAYDFTGDGVYDPIGVMTGNTLLQTPPSTFGRYPVIGFIDDFGVATYLPYGFTGTGAPVRAGWNSHLFYNVANPDGKIYLAVYDFLDPDALIDDHVWEIDLLTDPTVATKLTSSTTALHGGWARFALDGNGTFWELADNSSAVPLNIAISTDGASTFTVVDSLGSNDPTFWGTGFSNDPIIVASGDNIAVFNNVLKLGSLAKLGLGTAGTTDPDSANGSYLWYSTDGGNSWQGDWILLEGDNVITNRPNYEPLFQNYDVGSHTIDAQGNIHVVQSGVNSIGLVGTDTINVYPLMYWNNRDNNWMSLELPAVETAPYTSALTWGNVIGAGRPVVQADASGNVVVVMWNRAQFEGEPGNSAINTYPGPTAYYNYDVVYAYSTDGGVTFSTPEIIARSLGNSYMYPNIGGIQIANGEATVHYTYYWDKIPGSFILSQNAKSVDNVLIYNTVSFPYTPAAEIPVTFQVDMGVQACEGTFPAGANVVVRGDFQMAFGDTANWGGNMFQLSDVDGDTIYTGTFNAPAALAGNNYNHKFVIVNPPAGDNWESTPNRPFTVTSPSTTLPVVWFNNDDECTVVTEVTNTLVFTADITNLLNSGVGGAFDPAQDSLLVMGLDWDNLGKNVVGNRRMINENFLEPGIYTTTLTFTSSSASANGVGDSTKWKFKAFPDARFADGGWESGSDRWHYYQADGSVITLPVLTPGILALQAPLVNATPVEFTVDMTGAINRYNGLPIPVNELQFVGLRGGADFLGNWSSGGWQVSDTTSGFMKVLQNVGGNLWRTTVIAPVGQNSGPYQFKFAAVYPGADTVNGGSSPLDNEAGFGANHTFILTDSPSGITLYNLFGDMVNDVKEVAGSVPVAFELGQNYPNPFNPSTTIKFSIPEAGLVTLRVFNLLGQEVVTLLNGEKTAGVYEASFDASALSSGVYFYTLEAKNFSSTKKMVLLK